MLDGYKPMDDWMFDFQIYEFLDGVILAYCPECLCLIFVDKEQFNGTEPTTCESCGFEEIINWNEPPEEFA